MALVTDLTRCSVYAIQADSGEIKLGIARNVAKRLETLQIGSHQTLTIVGGLIVNDRQVALKAEAMLHELYKDSLVRGEWYQVPAEQVRRDMQLMKAVYGLAAERFNSMLEARAKRWEYFNDPFLTLDSAADFVLRA